LRDSAGIAPASLRITAAEGYVLGDGIIRPTADERLWFSLSPTDWAENGPAAANEREQLLSAALVAREAATKHL
jgi:hypothetical protein